MEGFNLKKPRHHERIEKTVNMLYILPMLLVFAVFILYPMTSVMKLSLFDKKINGEMLFVGLQNFKDFFADSDTPRVLLNTAVWVFAVSFKAGARSCHGVGSIQEILWQEADHWYHADSVRYACGGRLHDLAVDVQPYVRANRAVSAGRGYYEPSSKLFR
jgi:hypothetical protein